MTTSTLPQELVDMIIDQLSGDRAALASASLVCKSWVPVVWRYLFSKVSANCSKTLGSDGLVTLLGSPIIESTTNICQYICELRLRSDSVRTEEQDFDIPSLMNTIFILPSLQTLLLDSLYLPYSKTAIQSPSSRGNLEKLVFCNTVGRRAALLSIIDAFQSIGNLQIINMNWPGYTSGATDDVEIAHEDPTHIESIVLNFSRLYGTHVAGTAPGLHRFCHALRSLDITFPGLSDTLTENITGLCDLISAAKTTLTDLRLDVSHTNLQQEYLMSPSEDWKLVSQTLTQCTALRSLHFALYVEIFPNIDPPPGESGPNPENAFQWNTLTYLLSEQLPQLTSLSIAITSVDCYGDWRRFDFGVSGVDWSAIEKAILAQKSLDSVVFSHREIFGHGFGKREPYRQSTATSIEQWKIVLKSYLPTLLSSGRVRFTTINEE